MKKAGVPIVPGTTEAGRATSRTPTDRRRDRLPDRGQGGGGGGGKGFRVALEPDELEDAFEGASREGEKFFCDDTVYLERYLPRPAPRRGPDPRRQARQRHPPRRARLLHPAPPPEADRGVARRRLVVDEDARSAIGKIAVDAAKAVDYVGAGTIEGLLQGRRVLLPGDEHPRAGRALRDRDGAPASTSCASRSASPPASRSAITQDDVVAARPRHRVPHQRRGRRAGTSRPPRRPSARTCEPSGPGVRVDSGVARAAPSRRSTTRWSPS